MRCKSSFVFVGIFLIATTLVLAQNNRDWYTTMPRKAELAKDGLTMKIGNNYYDVYNAFSPIVPRGGERVLDFKGTLHYYLWFFSKNGEFNIARIDLEFNIYYYDEQAEQFISPDGKILRE